MKIQIISLFPDMFRGVLDQSMLFKAQNKNIIEINYINLRDYGLGKRKTVDDTPYGGGDGMLLMIEPLTKAIESAKKSSLDAEVILMTPRGEPFKQSLAKRLANDKKDKIIVCARYEGYDERVIQFVDRQISIGNYILTGGEIPAMVLVDAVVRLLPGVLGGENSAEIESFSDDKTLEFPQYTRPEDFRGSKVPNVLLSGNHGEIAKWRQDRSKKAKP
ncbi:MAG TPA: tRNA (guanosine(37)-N1)-methyltransferase TrmD [Candidatus Saccharimonadales bacterium]|nr:tRNA (guanosine(37)-N1)-methyltransferase TrmD [Candidatus Saccharimonadales bacterium]